MKAFCQRVKKQRIEVLSRLKGETRTTVFYEAPHHLLNTLKDIYKYAGNRQVAVERELTKRHETVNKGSINDLISYFEENEPKGEFVIVVNGANPEEIKSQEMSKINEMSILDHFNIYIAQGLDEKSAMKQVAKDRGIGKRDVYAELKKN